MDEADSYSPISIIDYLRILVITELHSEISDLRTGLQELFLVLFVWVDLLLIVCLGFVSLVWFFVFVLGFLSPAVFKLVK